MTKNEFIARLADACECYKKGLPYLGQVQNTFKDASLDEVIEMKQMILNLKGNN